MLSFSFVVNNIGAIMKNYYKLYNLPYDASEDLIKSKYRELALLHHPDKNLSDVENATIKFREIQEAFKHLNDPNYRKIFSKNKRISEPVFDNISIVDATPPKFDIWGKPLNQSQREYWDKLNKTHRKDIYKVKNNTNENGFIDIQNYERDKDIHIR